MESTDQHLVECPHCGGHMSTEDETDWGDGFTCPDCGEQSWSGDCADVEPEEVVDGEFELADDRTFEEGAPAAATAAEWTTVDDMGDVPEVSEQNAEAWEEVAEFLERDEMLQWIEENPEQAEAMGVSEGDPFGSGDGDAGAA